MEVLFSCHAGKGEEQSLAASVLTLLCLQMGSGPEGEEVFRSLKPLLISILTDSSASPIARQSVSSKSPGHRSPAGFQGRRAESSTDVL